MKKDIINYYSSIALDILYLVLGLFFFFRFQTVWVILYILSILMLILNAAIQIYNTIAHHAFPLSKVTLFRILINIGVTIFIVALPDYFFRFIHVIVGWWMLLHGFANFVTYYVYRRDSIKGGLLLLLKGIVDTIISIIMILRPFDKLWILSYIAGAYFLFFGVTNLIGKIIDSLPNKKKLVIHRHLSFSTPIFIALFVPYSFHVSIHKMMKENALEVLHNTDNDTPTSCEIYVYFKGSGHEILGHIDISFRGTIYSYGLHDPKARKLNGTLGDGVLIAADRNKFIQQSISYDNKTVVAYSLKLTQAQEEIILHRLDSLFERSVEWKSEAQIAEENGQDNSSINDYASRIYKSTGASMVKFKEGKFRTYFVASTNCVLLADELVRSSDLNLIDVNGIVTPGTYLGFLNSEYLSHSPIIVKRTIYRK